MDDNNSMDVNFTDLDLNQEPENPDLSRVSRVRSLMNEMDSVHSRIEERIRQLEAVVARARQRQRWRESRNNIESTYVPSETIVAPSLRAEVRASISVPLPDRTTERGRCCKRDSSHLISEALETENEAKNKDKESGSYYDCNICLELAKDPVLTSCGHLFCWACFYQVAKVDSDNKECPVCKGGVSDNTVIPIYGNGGNESACETTELGLKIPPRPKGQRIESVRQQLSALNGLSPSHVMEALRRIRITFGGMGNEMHQEGNNSNILNLDFPVSQEGQQNEQSTLRHRSNIQQVSRVLSESAASLSSLSSALSSAERLVEDLETVINNRLLRNVPQPTFLDGASSGDRNVSVTQAVNDHVPISSEPPVVPPSESREIPNIVRVLTRRAAASGLSEVASSSSSPPIRIRSVTVRRRDRDPREATRRRRRLN